MIMWLIGGIDPTGGAGLHRDVATLRAVAPRISPVTMPTAHTRQGHGGPAEATPVEPGELQAMASAAARPAAIKIGLVPAAVASVVAGVLARHEVPIVVDPVLAASDGGRMGASAEALCPVLDLATVITPNRSEAAQLSGLSADDPRLVDALAERWPDAWVLLKDGHGGDPDEVCDHLAYGGERHRFARARRPGPDPRGTGCALATAIAAGLASRLSVHEAVRDAIAWLDVERTRARPGPDGRPHLPDGS